MSEISAPVTVEIKESVLCLAVGTVEVNISRATAKTIEAKLLDKLPRSCHSEVEQLLLHGDFTAKDLYVACDRGALGTRGGRLARKHVLLDYFTGMFFFMKALAMLLLSVLAGLEIDSVEEALSSGAQVMGLAVLHLVLMWGTLKWFIWPQHTARDAVRAARQI